MKNTVIIRKDYLHYIKKYNRFEKRHKNTPIHVSPAFRVKVGDEILAGQCRPLSKTVRFNMLKVIRVAGGDKKGFSGIVTSASSSAVCCDAALAVASHRVAASDTAPLRFHCRCCPQIPPPPRLWPPLAPSSPPPYKGVSSSPSLSRGRSRDRHALMSGAGSGRHCSRFAAEQDAVRLPTAAPVVDMDASYPRLSCLPCNAATRIPYSVRL
eukprot:4101812-Prymnesium_polylepis.1